MLEWITPVLKQTKKDINATLSEIDKDLKAAAKELSGVGLKGDGARKILNDLRKFRPYVVDCAIINTDGVNITVEPDEYKKYEDIRPDHRAILELDIALVGAKPNATSKTNVTLLVPGFWKPR